MPCYLCAYQSTDQPEQPDPLPTGSPASPSAPLVAARSDRPVRWTRYASTERRWRR